MKTKNTSKIGLGMLLSAVVGAVAGLFLAPKAGKELRKDAKNLSKNMMKSASSYSKKLEKKTPEQIAKIVFGDVTESSMKIANRVKKELTVELAKLEKKYDTIDKKKYSSAVKSVVDGIKKEGSVPSTTLKKLASYLQDDARTLVGKKKPAAKKSSTRKPVAKKEA